MDKKYCEQLARILMCPKTKKPLEYDNNLHAFVNKETNSVYRIEDGIPILLDEEAVHCNENIKKEESEEDDSNQN